MSHLKESSISKSFKSNINETLIKLPSFAYFAKIAEALHIAALNVNKLVEKMIFINKNLKHVTDTPNWQKLRISRQMIQKMSIMRSTFTARLFSITNKK